MNEERVRAIVRNFPENGLKQVLMGAENVRELLSVARAEVLPRLLWKGLKVDPTTYVTADYRHVSSDLVLSVPLLPSQKGRRRRQLLLTILLELQMQPDRLMLLRILDYLVQIWKQQVREYGKEHESLASVQLHPILPVVLHTGSYSWETLGTLLDLMEDADELKPFIPTFSPLFVSLPDLSAAELQERGGYFGQVLALVKARKASRAAFAEVLGRTVSKLEELRGQQRLRRLELLSYVEAFVYHSREGNEHQPLRQRIDSALHEDEARLEVDMARKTIAEAEGERYTLVERKRTLINQLRRRWPPLSPEIEQTIQNTLDPELLSAWLDNFATASDLKSVGIPGTGK